MWLKQSQSVAGSVARPGTLSPSCAETAVDPGRVPAAPAAYRPVDTIHIHRQPIDAPTLLAALVQDSTRYLVLDLDRTIHRGWNIGELLGWEIIAWHHFGDVLLENGQPGRQATKLHLDFAQPWTLLRYLARGAQLWTVPGLRYLFSVKLASRKAWSRRLAHRLYGPEPVGTRQAIPRVVAMHHFSEVPIETSRTLARRVWERHSADQVILRDDLDQLRARFPRLKIILSSASPQPVLDVAKVLLNVDDVIFTTIALHDGSMAAPYRVDMRYGMAGLPERLAGPSALVHNSGKNKMRALQERYPDIADGSAECVGVTDTGYGEDHDWANHFTRVADINSGHPFSPLVTHASPLREVWSAQVTTRGERAVGGSVAEPVARRFGTETLRTRFASDLATAQSLHERAARQRRDVAPKVTALADALRVHLAAIDGAVGRYNAGGVVMRQTVHDELLRLCREEDELLARLAMTQRPLSSTVCALRDVLAGARRRLDDGPSPTVSYV